MALPVNEQQEQQFAALSLPQPAETQSGDDGAEAQQLPSLPPDAATAVAAAVAEGGAVARLRAGNASAPGRLTITDAQQNVLLEMDAPDSSRQLLAAYGKRQQAVGRGQQAAAGDKRAQPKAPRLPQPAGNSAAAKAGPGAQTQAKGGTQAAVQEQGPKAAPFTAAQAANAAAQAASAAAALFDAFFNSKQPPQAHKGPGPVATPWPAASSTGGWHPPARAPAAPQRPPPAPPRAPPPAPVGPATVRYCDAGGAECCLPATDGRCPQCAAGSKGLRAWTSLWGCKGELYVQEPGARLYDWGYAGEGPQGVWAPLLDY